MKVSVGKGDHDSDDLRVDISPTITIEYLIILKISHQSLIGR
jgi:hypothetical protein